MKIAISQSNYIPWKGYFDMIATVDTFVLYDDMQYTRRDWRNRNKIVTPNGLIWLTIPVEVKGRYFQKINETKVAGSDWATRHIKTLALNYKKSEYFERIFPMVEKWYHEAGQYELLTDINRMFLLYICEYLNIKTKIVSSSEYEIRGSKSDALISVLKQIPKSDTYVSGPSAKAYLDVDLFKQQGIKVEWIDYCGYAPYSQISNNFEHGVSILDMIFNLGSATVKYLK